MRTNIDFMQKRALISYANEREWHQMAIGANR